MLTHIVEFLDKCSDPFTLTIPNPQDAVRLVNHPIASARWKIYSEEKLIAFQKEKTTDYYGVELNSQERETARVGRAMTIGLVAVYQQLMNSTKSPDLEPINNLIRVIDCLNYFLILGEVNENQFPEIQKLPTLSAIVNQKKIEDVTPTLQGIKTALKLRLESKADEFKKLFGECWEQLQELIYWFTDSNHTLAIMQGKQDLIALQQKTEDALSSVQYPSLGIYYRALDVDELAWLRKFNLIQEIDKIPIEKEILDSPKTQGRRLALRLSQVNLKKQQQLKSPQKTELSIKNCNS